MRKKWEIRIGILIVLFVFGIYLRVHRKATSYIKRYTLVNVKDTTGIAGFGIIKGKDTILIKKHGEQWVVVLNGREFPANNAKAWELAGKVVKANYQIASESPKDLGTYGIDTTSFVFEIFTNDGKTVRLKVGKRGPTYNSFYFVFPGKKKVYLLMGIPRYTISTDVDAYRDRKVVDIKKEDIKSLIICNGPDTLLIKRKKDTFIAIPELDTASIMATLNRARVMTAFGFADEEPDSVTGLENTDKKIVLITQSDDTFIVFVGNKGKYALYVTTNKRPGEVFKVYRNWFDEILKKAGLLKEEKAKG